MIEIRGIPFPAQVFGTPVEYRPVDPVPADATRFHEFQVATPDTVWLMWDDLRVMVRGTDLVVVELGPDGDPTMVGPMLYGWAARALMLHAGTFNLHASLVRIGDEHVMIGGSSGAGKSTTVVALQQRNGAAVIIDDVVPVKIADGRAIAHPFPRPVHLTADAVARIGVDLDLEQVGSGPRGKFAVDLASSAEPVGIDRLVTLTLHGAPPDLDDPDGVPGEIDRADDPVAEASLTPDQPVLVRHVPGAERLRSVVRLSNNSGYASWGDRSRAFFAWSTQLAAALPTLQIDRLHGPDSLDTVCNAVMSGAPPVG